MDTEWQLKPKIFGIVCQVFGTPVTDLFTTCINAQLTKYISWRPDPTAVHVDAFTYDWSKDYHYAFPPFSVVGRVMQKAEEEGANLLLVIPHWPTRPWYPQVMRRLVDDPIQLPMNCLQLPQTPQVRHPLATKLNLICCKVSGNRMHWKEYRSRLPSSSQSRGGQARKNNITLTYSVGSRIVIDDKLVPILHL